MFAQRWDKKEETMKIIGHKYEDFKTDSTKLVEDFEKFWHRPKIIFLEMLLICSLGSGEPGMIQG